MTDEEGALPDFEKVLLVGVSPTPEIVRGLMDTSDRVAVIFYGEGVNNLWNGEKNFFFLLQDVAGRGHDPFSQCLSDLECARILLSARKVLTF